MCTITNGKDCGVISIHIGYAGDTTSNVIEIQNKEQRPNGTALRNSTLKDSFIRKGAFNYSNYPPL